MMLLGEIFGMKLSAASDILLGRSHSLAYSVMTRRSPLSHIYALTLAISMRFVLAGVILSAGDSNALQALTGCWI